MIPTSAGVETPGGGLPGDADCHLGVIGPLTRLPPEAAPAIHQDRHIGPWVGELVPGPQRIPASRAEQGTDDAIC